MSERARGNPRVPPIVQYSIAVVSVGISLGIARVLDLYLVPAPVSLLLSAILLSGWFGEFRGGLFAAALSLVAFQYYYVMPLHSLVIATNEIPRTIVFALSAVFVGWLSGAQKSTTESLTDTRDQLRNTVDELTRANERLKAEDAERRRTAEALLQARADLGRASRVTTMGELTASLAHEVNQPIAAAVMNANSCYRWLSGDTPNIEEARAAANRIVQNGTRASEIITRVGRLFKKSAHERELVDINGVIRDTTVLLEGEAAQYSVSIKLELAPDLPDVSADRVQLQQVMMNLIINGIDAVKTVDDERVLTISSELTKNERLLVSVCDSGIGLPEQQAQIFNPFFTTKLQGIGMGLSISRSIIESHGGRLWASDNNPRGAKFHFTLPFVPGPAERTVAVIPSASE